MLHLFLLSKRTYNIQFLETAAHTWALLVQIEHIFCRTQAGELNVYCKKHGTQRKAGKQLKYIGKAEQL